MRSWSFLSMCEGKVSDLRNVYSKFWAEGGVLLFYSEERQRSQRVGVFMSCDLTSPFRQILVLVFLMMRVQPKVDTNPESVST